jgi:hypothetical protein
MTYYRRRHITLSNHHAKPWASLFTSPLSISDWLLHDIAWRHQTTLPPLMISMLPDYHTIVMCLATVLLQISVHDKPAIPMP